MTLKTLSDCACPRPQPKYSISYYQLLLLKAIKNILNIHKETCSSNVLMSIIEDAERSAFHISQQSEWKFAKDCMCNKYTNCTDCQKHDEEMRQSEWDKVLDDFVLWNGTREIFHAVQDYKRKLRCDDSLCISKQVSDRG